jgi:hypothetical protein
MGSGMNVEIVVVTIVTTARCYRLIISVAILITAVSGVIHRDIIGLVIILARMCSGIVVVTGHGSWVKRLKAASRLR